MFYYLRKFKGLFVQHWLGLFRREALVLCGRKEKMAPGLKWLRSVFPLFFVLSMLFCVFYCWLTALHVEVPTHNEYENYPSAEARDTSYTSSTCPKRLLHFPLTLNYTTYTILKSVFFDGVIKGALHFPQCLHISHVLTLTILSHLTTMGGLFSVCIISLPKVLWLPSNCRITW